jgi:hypothetical protein
MFNLEIKRISLKSVALSAYPFVVFVFSLLSSFIGLGDVIDPGTGVFKALIQILLNSLFQTAVIVLFTVLAGLIYNMLVLFGLKGIRIALADVDEQEKDKEEVPAVEENK